MEPIWKSIVSTLNESVEVNAFEVNLKIQLKHDNCRMWH